MKQEEWDQIEAEQLLEAWQYELSDIRHADTWYVYLAMFGMAESVHQLERLHGSLPENVQLLRRDFIRLKKYWQHCFDNTRKERREMFLKKVLVALIWGSNGESAANYYLAKIREWNTYKPLSHFAYGEDGKGGTLSYLEIRPCASDYYYAMLFGKKFRVHFETTMDRLFFKTIICVRESQLTENIAHHILEKLPRYYIQRYGVLLGSSDDPIINLTFQNEITSDLQCAIMEVTQTNCASNPILLRGKAQFVTVMAGALRHNGIPVEGDLLIEAHH